MEAAPQGPAARPQRGWFARNWLWFIPAGLLLLVVLCAGGGYAIVLVIFAKVKSLEPYQMALKQVQQDPQVIAQLGQPVEDITRFPSAEYHVEDGRGDATVNFDVAGPQGKARVFCQARRMQGTWSLSILEVTVEKTGQRLNLDTSQGGGPGDAPLWKSGG